MLKITPHPPLSRSPFSRWRRLFIRFFFCTCRRKRKSYQKENAERRFRALRSATADTGGSCKPLKRLERNFYYGAQKISEKKSRGAAFISCAEPRAHHHSYSHSGEVPPPLFVCFSVRQKSPCRPSFLFSRRNTAENLSRHFREHHG